MSVQPVPPAPSTPGPDRPRTAFRTAMRGLAVLGLVLPWVFNLRYFASGGSIAPSVFWRDAAANALTTAITVDVYLAAIAFSCWVLHERRVRRPWVPVLMCFGIGLSFALPWYLSSRTPLNPDAAPAAARH